MTSDPIGTPRHLVHHVAGRDLPGPLTLDVVSPGSSKVVATVAAGDADVVDRAVAAARSALARPVPTHVRAAALDAVAERLATEREAWARLIVEEAGKPVTAARVEVDRCVSTLRFSAAEARTSSGEVVPMGASAAGAGKLAFTVHEPIGVVAAITPFNFPLNLVAHKVGPAVAAGCPVVLKPAEKAPSAGHRLAVAFEEAGLPAGFVNVVHGGGTEVAGPLARHAGVDAVSFTGSVRAGRAIEREATGKPVLLELGGNAPLLVQPDADLARVAAAVRTGGFAHAGQSCISVQRVLAHADVHDEVVARIVEAAATLVVGDPLDDATEVGPLIRVEEAERVERWVDDAVAAGATLALGGRRDGAYLQPTVLTGVDPDAPICREEVFGPVVVVLPYRDIADGIALANRSAYGLNAAVFTNDLASALTAWRGLRAGAVLVNESPTFRADQMPYGGVGDSGTAREGPRWTMRDLTVTKLLIVQA